jgi:hypothetical protein
MCQRYKYFCQVLQTLISDDAYVFFLEEFDAGDADFVAVGGDLLQTDFFCIGVVEMLPFLYDLNLGDKLLQACCNCMKILLDPWCMLQGSNEHDFTFYDDLAVGERACFSPNLPIFGTAWKLYA